MSSLGATHGRELGQQLLAVGHAAGEDCRVPGAQAGRAASAIRSGLSRSNPFTRSCAAAPGVATLSHGASRVDRHPVRGQLGCQRRGEPFKEHLDHAVDGPWGDVDGRERVPLRCAAAREEMLRIQPSPRSIIPGTTSWASS